MIKFVHRKKVPNVGTMKTIQGFHKSMREVFEHFLSTGELLIDPTYQESFDNTDPKVSVEDFDINAVVKDVSLVESALLSHNTITNKEDKPIDENPVEPSAESSTAE